MVALAPGIVLAGTINWDMWAVGLLALGMYFFSRERLVLAGVLIGLGTATKLYPVLILGAILLLALRTGRSGHSWSLRGGRRGLAGRQRTHRRSRIPRLGVLLRIHRRTGPAGYSSPWFAYNLVAGRLRWPVLTPEAINTLALTSLCWPAS